jgi:hypothetical protein
MSLLPHLSETELASAKLDYKRAAKSNCPILFLAYAIGTDQYILIGPRGRIALSVEQTDAIGNIANSVAHF